MATRFHFAASGAAAVSPATQSYTHGSSTRRQLRLFTNTTLTDQTVTPDAADHIVAGDVLVAQFVSDPLVAQTFTSGDAFKFAFQCTESNAGNNLNLQVWMGIVSNDGTSAVGTIRSKVEDAPECATTLMNRFGSGTLSGTVSCSQGDRLVIELSMEGTPVATGGVQGHNGTIRFGGSGTSGDLPENDTEAGTTFNGWLEFANTIDIIPPNGEAWTERPLPRPSLSAIALTLAVNLLGSTLAPAEAPEEVYSTSQPMLMVAAAPAPRWHPPNLLQTTLAPTEEAPVEVYYTGQTTMLAAAAQAPQWHPLNLLGTTLAPTAEAPRPFRLLDWPRPRPAVVVPDLRTIGCAYVFDTNEPPATQSIDTLPKLRREPPITQRTWTQNLLASTLAPVAGNPFIAKDWSAPQRKGHPVALRTWTQNRPAFYQEPAAGPKPFAHTSWPNPRPPVTPAFLLTRTTYYVFDTNEPPATQPIDTLPKPRPHPIALRTWTQNLLASTLSLPVEAPRRPFDWPNPRARARATGLETWVNTRRIFHQDIQPFDLADWPTPAPYRHPVALRTWTHNLLESTLALPVEAPRRPFDWPLPQGKAFPGILRTAINTRQPQLHQDIKPFLQSQWPNPAPARVLPPTWTQNLLQSTLAPTPQTKPFGQADWPNPQGKAHPISLRTATDGRKAYHQDVPAFVQTSWPNPARALVTQPHTWTQNLLVSTSAQPVPFAQHSWPHPAPARVLAVSQLTVTDGRKPYQVDYQPPPASWPLPQGKRPHVVDSWAPNLLATTLKPETLPFNQEDWPNPRGKAYPHTLRTSTDGRKAYHQDIKPFHQSDWPTPAPSRRGLYWGISTGVFPDILIQGVVLGRVIGAAVSPAVHGRSVADTVLSRTVEFQG